ncbi:hypothetical protein ACYSNW_07495 [Enterococcus sp. LJL99]
MTGILNTIVVLAFLGCLSGIGFLIFSFIKKKPKKPVLIGIAVSFVVMIVAIILSPAEAVQLTISETTIETNENGIAQIKGTTNKTSKVTADGDEIENDDGSFVYDVTLKDDESKEITLVANKAGKEITKTVEIKPSKSFVALLKEEEMEKKEQKILAEAETALALAEKNPTSKNYDDAATLVESLSKQYDEMDERLATIKENIPIYVAVDLAEKEQNRQKLDSATALVSKATLNKEALEKRLTTVKEKIEAKETAEKQLTSAREAVEKAEQEPNDTNYDQAIAKIKAIPNGNTDLSNRMNTVKQTIDAQKEEAKRVAEAQKAEQEAASAQATADAAAAAEAPVSEMVLVTPTGKKYHNHRCGNGTYTEATLEAALARGLTPCAKCY